MTTTQPDPYASADQSAKAIKPDTRSAAEKQLDAAMDAAWANEQGNDRAEYFGILRRVAIDLIERQGARIAELQAQLEAVGAGGVSRLMPASQWVPVSERLPKSGKAVLLDTGKTPPLRAIWVPKFFLEAGDEAPEDFGEYDEATDAYYCPQGWYEWNQNEEVHWAVSETPVHWMPLPPPTRHHKGVVMNQKERVAFVEHLGGPGPWSESVIKNVIEYNPAAWAAWQARAALAAEPATVEPACDECGGDGIALAAQSTWVCEKCATPQPAAQPAPERQPLTSEDLFRDDDLMSLNAELGLSICQLTRLARAIEAAHRIKGASHE